MWVELGNPFSNSSSSHRRSGGSPKNKSTPVSVLNLSESLCDSTWDRMPSQYFFDFVITAPTAYPKASVPATISVMPSPSMSAGERLSDSLIKKPVSTTFLVKSGVPSLDQKIISEVP